MQKTKFYYNFSVNLRNFMFAKLLCKDVVRDGTSDKITHFGFQNMPDLRGHKPGSFKESDNFLQF